MDGLKYIFHCCYKIQEDKTNCNELLFNANILSLLTAAKPHLRPCPYLGRYIVTGLSLGRHARPSGGTSVVSDTETGVTQCSDLQFQSLTVGCTEVNTMQFHSSCSMAETSSKFSLLTY
jgi:hypothetical protein